MSDLIKFPKSKESSIAELAIELATIQVKEGVLYTPELQEKCYRLAEQLYHQRTSQRVIMPFSESSFKEPQTKSTKKITKKQNRILDVAAETLETTAKDANSLVFMAKPFVQTTFPHRDVGLINDYYRRNGALTMSIRASYGDDLETGERICYGIPYGTVPRLLIIFFSTEVIKTGNRVIKLGKNLSDFMVKVGLSPRSRTGANSPTFRLKKQLMSLCTSS